MSTRDISCNCLSLIYGLKLFAESLQTEYFKSFSFGRNPKPGPPSANVTFSSCGTERQFCSPGLFKDLSTQYTLPAFKW